MAETATEARPETPHPNPPPRPVRKAWGIRFWFVSAWLYAIAVLFVAQYVPLKYTGTAIFERRTDPAGRDGSASPDQADSFEPIKLSLAHDLAGRTALEEAVEELGFTKGLPRGPDGLLTLEGKMKKQELVQGMLKDVDVKWDVKSDQLDQISVSFTHSDPERAQEMPNTLVKNYITKTSEKIINDLTASKDFLQKQVDTADVRVTELTNQRIEFEAKWAGMLPEDPGALQQQADRIMTDIGALRCQQTVAIQKLERNKARAKAAKSDHDEPRRATQDPKPNSDGNQDAWGIARVPDTMEPTSRGSTDVRMEIAAAQAEVDMTTSELERLQARLTQIQGLLANYAPVRQQYLELNKRLTEQEAKKDRWQYRLTEVQMDLQAEVAKRRTHLNQVQLAERQFRPMSPKLMYVLGFALGGGLAFATGLVLVHNMLNRTFARTLVWLARRLDATAVPTWPAGVCAECPAAPATQDRVMTVREGRRRRFRRLVVQPVIALVLLAVMAVAVLNITLWLDFPDQYEQWRASPWTYVSRQVADGFRWLGDPDGY